MTLITAILIDNYHALNFKNKELNVPLQNQRRKVHCKWKKARSCLAAGKMRVKDDKSLNTQPGNALH